MSTEKAAAGGQAGFWLTAAGGFLLGALTVLIVLFLAKPTNDREPPQPSQIDVPADAEPVPETPN
ncbi:MAG: hypothetical protein IT423_09620 [Pirellulaceae bacterium]|nr:hypothetical protein [Pirellulaceae bacterium]